MRKTAGRVIPLVIAGICVTSAADAQVQLHSTPEPPRCQEYVVQNTQLDGRSLPSMRLCVYATSLVTPSALFGASFFGAISQARNQPREWGQGAAGYSRRVGANYLQSMTKSTGEYLASWADKEDPRLYPHGPEENAQYGWKARIARAAFAPVYIWEPAGRRRWRFGYIAGSFASGFVGLAFYPKSQSDINDALIRSGTAFGGYEAYSFFTEFQPDMYGLFARLVGDRKPPKP